MLFFFFQRKSGKRIFGGAGFPAVSSPVRRAVFTPPPPPPIDSGTAPPRRDDVRATTGFVNVSPAIVTAFNGWCETSLDQRALDADVLADMLRVAKENSERVAGEEGCEVEDRKSVV